MTGDDVAVFTATVGVANPALVVARLANDSCHKRLLDAARATAHRAELRHRLAGLPLAGGALLVHSANGPGRRRLMAYLGHSLHDRACRFLPDGGLGANDLALLRSMPGETAEIGDLGRWTALGLFVAIERLVADRLAKPLSAASVTVQGLGTVGMALCELLDAAGAVLMVSDPRRERVRQATLLFNAIPLASERAITTIADVFAPCAPDTLIDAEAAACLSTRLVVGAADGLLADADAGDILHDRGIACAPDFVVNAGAAIAAAAPQLRLGRDDVEQRVRGIADTLVRVMARADRLRVPPDAAAHELAGHAVDGSHRYPVYA